ncbi:MAG: hypothetical protein JWN55_2557, partial [Frankiales bacterium]|nr:hypothetical protein [Frankiales bacterium]
HPYARALLDAAPRPGRRRTGIALRTKAAS